MKPDTRGAVDLSREAISARDREFRLRAAYGKTKAMTNTFKGIRGRRSRRFYAESALRQYDVAL